MCTQQIALFIESNKFLWRREFFMRRQHTHSIIKLGEKYIYGYHGNWIQSRTQQDQYVVKLYSIM